MGILTKNIDCERERVDQIMEEMKELDDTVTQNTTNIGRNSEHVNKLENTLVLNRVSIDETKHLMVEIDSKLKGLDEASSDRMGKAEENIKTNIEQISLLDGSSKYVNEQINNLFQTNLTIDAKIQELKEKSQNDMHGLENKLENMKDQNKYNIEKII